MSEVKIVRGNIVEFPADAIVNAANKWLLAGNGVCGAIFAAAGKDVLQAACDEITGRVNEDGSINLKSSIGIGNSAITPAFGIQTAKHIIHAVGPIYHEHSAITSSMFLASAYLSSLDLAMKNGCTSIVFPTISTGIYGYPLADACDIAYAMCRAYDGDITVYLIAYDDLNFQALTVGVTNFNRESHVS